ncbi:MAG: bifunctional helix-turn-helix transcriptional regulator/GNAT family N-acetyltransferase [Cytophagales bacterium]|nr:bifunctional helix-turn-helix transcriptional regulator/GNAT family N-acetyltransferase [Cytophagales bacterium]
MDFEAIGKMALGSRLRFLSEKVTEDAQQIYDAYGIELKPKWFPVFYFLSNEKSGKSITAIATEIGHSHPSVIKIVREMSKDQLVQEQRDTNDGRKNLIHLTKKGVELSIKIKAQYIDVENAIDNMLKNSKHNIWFALQEFEYILNEKTLYARVLEEKKMRESATVQIVDYQAKHHSAFRELNEAWINQYFRLEDADRQALDKPVEHILEKGGKILVAEQNNVVLGVCALLKMSDENYDYELAKMAVSAKARGLGIGSLLGKAVIEKARQLDASYLYLESNTILTPAISLYEKLGFKKITGRNTPYERCNIQMELKLNP